MPLTCEKYLSLEFLLKIDLWLCVWPLHINQGVFQLNETMFWYNDYVLKGFLPLHCSLHIPFPLKDWSQCRSLRPDSRVRRQICSPRGKLPRGKLPQGKVHTVVILVCLHYVRFKAAVPCLQHCQHYSCSAVSHLRILANKNTASMLIKTGNVLWWCVCMFD